VFAIFNAEVEINNEFNDMIVWRDWIVTP